MNNTRRSIFIIFIVLISLIIIVFSRDTTKSVLAQNNFFHSSNLKTQILPATITQVVDSLGNVNTDSWTKGSGGGWSCYPDCPDLELEIGEIITFNVTASDPNDLPIEYKFSFMRNGNITTAQDWSQDNTFVWTVTTDDVGPSNGLVIHVRNDDGHEWQGEELGDDYTYVIYKITDPNRTPATINKVVDSLGNITTYSVNKQTGGWSCYPDCPDLELKVGEKVAYTVTAYDPNNLPIEYKFSYSRGGNITTAQDWSENNTFEWIVELEDVGPSNGLVIHVRNDDGHEWQGEGLGDDYTYVIYKVIDPDRAPAIITQVVDSLGNINTNSWTKETGGDWSCNPNCPDLELFIGQIITYTVTASDPNDLPIEYEFSHMRNGNITTAQDWSEDNIFEWIVELEDIGPWSGISVHVRNNDGHEWQGEGLGDDYNYQTYTVYHLYINELEPNITNQGSSTINMTVNGVNFDSGSQVQFGENLLFTTFINSTKLTAVIPDNLLQYSGEIEVKVVGSESENVLDNIHASSKSINTNFDICQIRDLDSANTFNSLHLWESDFNSFESNIKTFVVKGNSSIYLPLIIN
ncbi:MAG: IPT/TIG domain-containing protein [Brevefilum sp.]